MARLEEAKAVLADSDSVEMTTFEQILEMDDGDDYDFSSSIVFGFFEQAESTFKKMDEELEVQDLKALSELGHFLKGSSATLGLVKIRDGCEHIQNFGQKKLENGEPGKDDDHVWLTKIASTRKRVELNYDQVKEMLEKFYETLKPE